MIKVNLSSLTHAKSGNQIKVDLDFGFLHIEDLKLSFLKGQITFTRIDDGILTQGPLSTEVKTECTRCLSPYFAPAIIELEDVINLSGAELTQ
ncbi:MAG: hypothetical protein P1S60_06420, partial [Anaerolineae bacterium]|nr:hypothetical protein [Anaerolineae bacterium]